MIGFFGTVRTVVFLNRPHSNYASGTDENGNPQRDGCFLFWFKEEMKK